MIKKANLLILTFAFSFLTFSACSNAKKTDATSVATGLTNNEESTRKLVDEQGTFIIDEKTGRPAIRVHTDGTIDEVFIYLITNSSSNLPDSNSKVRFSGKVSKSDVISNIGGHTYYELELLKFVEEE